MNQDITHTCSQCGSPLILVNKITEKIEGSRFPQTTFNYKCSNKVCQDERDKQTAKRIKLQEEKGVADQKRAEKKLEDKKAFTTLLEKKMHLSEDS